MSLRPAALFAVLALVAASCGSDSVSEPITAETPAPADGCPADVAAPLASWEGAGFRGAVLLVEDGETRCALGVGAADDAGTPISVDTVFSLGSVTKSITASTILSLVDDGLVTLETPVVDVLPELDGWTATVGDVLVHEGGFGAAHGGDEQTMTLDEALDLIGDEEPLFAPGEEFSYSNTGYTVLAAIVERVSGQPFRQAVRERMLTGADGESIGGWWNGEPAAAGPRAVGYLDGEVVGTGDPDAGPRWGLEGAGGIAMSPRELATWALALGDGTLLSARSVELATTTPSGDGETLGWVAASPPDVPEAGLFSAGGGGTGHNVVIGWWPEADRVLVMASNADAMRAEALFERTVGALIGDEPVPVAPEGGAIDPDLLTELVGEYRLDGGTVTVVATDDGAAVEVTGEALSAILPLTDELASGAVDHEDVVLAQLADPSERLPLEEAFGPINEVRVLATIFAENEFRTYVALAVEDGSEVVAWFAVAPNGELAAADVPAPPARRLLSSAAEGGFEVVTSDGTPNGVVLRSGDGGLVIVGPDGSEVVAGR